MAIELKLRKIGNSMGVVLPKEAVARLKIAEGDSLYATETPDGSYRLTAHDPEFAKQIEVAAKVIRRYRNTLKELAK